MITTVYGPHLQGEKQNFLDSIRAFRSLHHEKYWLIGGYFNLILNLNEKKGGIPREDLEMESFRDLLNDLRLVDIPTENGIFTWNNRRGETHQIASRLDHFLVSEDLITLDVHFEASILPSLGSDHWPISLSFDIKEVPKNRPFRFKLSWLRDPTFLDKVKYWWQSSNIQGRNRMHTFQLQLKHLKNEIKIWNKTHFGNIQTSMSNLQDRMKQVQQEIILQGRMTLLADQEGIILSELEERRKHEDILWK